MIHPLAAQIQQLTPWLTPWLHHTNDCLGRMAATNVPRQGCTCGLADILALLVGSGTLTPPQQEKENAAPNAPEEPNRDAVRSASPQQDWHEAPAGGRIVRVYRNGSWLEDSPAGHRKRYSWPDDSEAERAVLEDGLLGRSGQNITTKTPPPPQAAHMIQSIHQGER
jgi:hypothetical protein